MADLTSYNVPGAGSGSGLKNMVMDSWELMLGFIVLIVGLFGANWVVNTGSSAVTEGTDLANELADGLDSFVEV